MGLKLLIGFLFILLLNPRTIEERKDAFRGLASSWTIIPARSLAGLHYIFKGFEIEENMGLVKVTGPVVEITNNDQVTAKVFSEGYTSEMDPEDFEQEQTLGMSVFEATTRTGTTVGTAFLVGQQLVLTNRHVMAYTKNAKNWSCGKFSIKLNHKEERVDCQEVKWCSSKYDYCVIEMKAMKNGELLGAEVKPLRLSRKVRSDKDANLLHIGNAAGLGLQASIGKGIKIEGGEFFHYAPTLGGSSGAPIFDERGEVIGINWAHTGGTYTDESSFNRGVLSVTIFEELKKSRPQLVKEIKSFRSWFYRNSRHRNVKIVTDS